jgi:hypothetical protein
MTAIAITVIFYVAALWAGIMSARAYRGTWRRCLSIRPPLTLWGRHWGLLTLAIYAVAAAIGGTLLGLAQLGGGTTWIQVVALTVLIAGILVGLVVSHVLPERWRPAWYRSPGQDPDGPWTGGPSAVGNPRTRSRA